jgi:hypothetical protein
MAGLSHTYQNKQFAGTIVQEDGKRNRLKLNAPDYYHHALNQFKPGDYITITLTNKRPKRTVSQNNYYWGAYLPAIAAETGEYDLDALHELFKGKFLSKESVETPWGVATKVKSTTELSVLEFSEFIEKIAALTNIQPPPTSHYFETPPKQKHEKSN